MPSSAEPDRENEDPGVEDGVCAGRDEAPGGPVGALGEARDDRQHAPDQPGPAVRPGRPANGVPYVGDGVGDADESGQHTEHRSDLGHRRSTRSVRRAAEVGDRDRGRDLRVERPAGEHVDEAPARELVGVDGDRAGLDELHRRPALKLAVAEPLEPSGPCARMPIASITLGTKARMELGSSSRRAHSRADRSRRACPTACGGWDREPASRIGRRPGSLRRRSPPSRQAGTWGSHGRRRYGRPAALRYVDPP